MEPDNDICNELCNFHLIDTLSICQVFFWLLEVRLFLPVFHVSEILAGLI